MPEPPARPVPRRAVLNAVGHQRGGHCPQAFVDDHERMCSTPLGIKEAGMGSTRGSNRQMCSTPLGIKEAGMAGLRSARRWPAVLNAVGHQRGGHSQALAADFDGCIVCSTPLGIKEAGIPCGRQPRPASSGAQRRWASKRRAYRANFRSRHAISVLNAVGHQRGGHPGRLGGMLPCTVLNAVGHQRGGHFGRPLLRPPWHCAQRRWASKRRASQTPPRYGLPVLCSTPLGIKEAGIATSGRGYGENVLNAVGHQRGGHSGLIAELARRLSAQRRWASKRRA